MAKQNPLFPMEEDHDLDIWSSFPHETQLEIESTFAQILLGNLPSRTEKEVIPNES